MYEQDPRVVLTLDAGGTNFVFSAIQGCREIVTPVRLDAVNNNVEACLARIVEGFRKVEAMLDVKPVAISFAFPGPADYAHGVIGDLPNFPCFRGGVALGPFLEAEFGIPVFVNNDGNLFAYGEALAGKLSEINAKLEAAGSSKRYKNLIGLTWGTGYGAGVVINGKLLTGDNGCGGDVWCMRNVHYPDFIAEEGVSIRAVKRVYHEYAPEDTRDLSPIEICKIADGTLEGNPEAAKRSFAELGETAADAVIDALNIADGIVVAGGGIAYNHKYILPAMVERMKTRLGTFRGDTFPCLQMDVYNLMDEEDFKKFAEDDSVLVDIPGHEGKVRYERTRKTGVAVTSIGASTAICVGSYAFALAQIDAAKN